MSPIVTPIELTCIDFLYGGKMLPHFVKDIVAGLECELLIASMPFSLTTHVPPKEYLQFPQLNSFYYALKKSLLNFLKDSTYGYDALLLHIFIQIICTIMSLFVRYRIITVLRT